MPSLEAVARRVQTLRYYRAGQVLARLANIAMRPFASARLARVLRLPALEPRGERLSLVPLRSPSARLVSSADRIVLRALGRSVELSRPVDWRTLDALAPTRLWRFHLHYHEFFEDAAFTDSGIDPGSVWEFIDAWICQFTGTPGKAVDDAWHPYVVSRRIPVWVKLFESAPPPEPIRRRVVTSLTAQFRWLADNLEWDVRGNHLVQNLRGLAVAAAFFRGPEADHRLQQGGRYLRDQLPEQILPHGEHFERSPAYHIDMLAALADIRAAGLAAQGTWANQLDGPIERMAHFLRRILHPDGQIPLFGDSTLDQYPAPKEVLAALGLEIPTEANRAARSECVGDYWIFRCGADSMIFDAGPAGPDHLPAHAHADLLTFEASWQGKRLFVDGGVSDYGDTPARAFCRGTSAHNVLEIDGLNQCDVWSRFRMGRRGWPERLRCGQDGPFHWARCAHNAYRFVGVPRVGRLMVCVGDGPWIILDWADGHGKHRFVNRLRLGPDWSVAREDGALLTVTDGRESLAVRTLSGAEVRRQPTQYYPFFGCSTPVIALEQEAETAPPYVSGWIISRTSDEAPMAEVRGTSVLLHWRDYRAEIGLT
ncbi:hypothetical protein JCM17478_35970 [Thermopirellula anaerolimosa]